MVAIVFIVTSAHNLSTTKTVPFVAGVCIVSGIKSAGTYYSCISWHWIRKKRRVLWILVGIILNVESTRTTYIDWQRIQWLAALCGKLCTGWAYFYHRDHFSLNNLRRSSMAADPSHILGCSDCYIRSILLLNLIYLFHGPKNLISFFCYFTGHSTEQKLFRKLR